MLKTGCNIASSFQNINKNFSDMKICLKFLLFNSIVYMQIFFINFI